MAILERVKERIETDISDGELDTMIKAVQAEIDDRHGADGVLTVYLDGDRDLDGDRRFLTLARPVDTAQAIALVEIDGSDQTTLDADDYRVLHGGRTLERLSTGPNGRSRWQRLVKATYTPVSDARQRDEITIQVVALDLTYRGLNKQVSYGDVSEGGSVTADAYTRERDELLDSLGPRRGLLMA